MATYVYRTNDGSLYSWSPDNNTPTPSDADLALRGFAKVTGLASLDSTHVWDAPTHTVVVVTAPTPIRFISVFDWINRFTPAELAGIRASSNNGVQKFLFMVPLAFAQNIDLNGDAVQSVMTLLVNQSLLTQARANAIVS